MENKEKQEGTQEITFGNLYELNKNLVEKNEMKLSESIINSKKEIIKNFMLATDNKNYMLLSKDYGNETPFILTEKTVEKIREAIDILVDECLVNRGEIRGIDLTKDRGAIEIWLSTEGESYVYYFFPNDCATIEV